MALTKVAFDGRDCSCREAARPAWESGRGVACIVWDDAAAQGSLLNDMTRLSHERASLSFGRTTAVPSRPVEGTK